MLPREDGAFKFPAAARGGLKVKQARKASP